MLFRSETILYWLTFPFLILLLVAPIVQWFTGVPAMHATAADVLLIVVPRVLSRCVIMYWLSEGKVMPLVGTVGKVVPAFHITLVVFQSMWNPFGAPFRVTTKGQSRDGVIVHWRLFGVFAGLAGMLVLGMFVNLLGFYEVVALSDVTPLDVGWSLASLLVLTLAAMACVELPPRPGGRGGPPGSGRRDREGDRPAVVGVTRTLVDS